MYTVYPGGWCIPGCTPWWVYQEGYQEDILYIHHLGYQGDTLYIHHLGYTRVGILHLGYTRVGMLHLGYTAGCTGMHTAGCTSQGVFLLLGCTSQGVSFLLISPREEGTSAQRDSYSP